MPARRQHSARSHVSSHQPRALIAVKLWRRLSQASAASVAMPRRPGAKSGGSDGVGGGPAAVCGGPPALISEHDSCWVSLPRTPEATSDRLEARARFRSIFPAAEAVAGWTEQSGRSRRVTGWAFQRETDAELTEAELTGASAATGGRARWHGGGFLSPVRSTGYHFSIHLASAHHRRLSNTLSASQQPWCGPAPCAPTFFPPPACPAPLLMPSLTNSRAAQAPEPPAPERPAPLPSIPPLLPPPFAPARPPRRCTKCSTPSPPLAPAATRCRAWRAARSRSARRRCRCRRSGDDAAACARKRVETHHPPALPCRMMRDAALISKTFTAVRQLRERLEGLWVLAAGAAADAWPTHLSPPHPYPPSPLPQTDADLIFTSVRPFVGC